jgi:hypothetical protein
VLRLLYEKAKIMKKLALLCLLSFSSVCVQTMDDKDTLCEEFWGVSRNMVELLSYQEPVKIKSKEKSQVQCSTHIPFQQKPAQHKKALQVSSAVAPIFKK